MKILLNSEQRDAVRSLHSDCPLMGYVRSTFTSEMRCGLMRFRPSAEDVYVEVRNLLDAWKENLHEEMTPAERYTPFEHLLCDLEDAYRDLYPEATDDCKEVSRIVVAMLMSLFSTQRKCFVECVHISNALFKQIYAAFDMNDDDTLAFTKRFAPYHGRDIGAWMKEYLTSDEQMEHLDLPEKENTEVEPKNIIPLVNIENLNISGGVNQIGDYNTMNTSNVIEKKEQSLNIASEQPTPTPSFSQLVIKPECAEAVLKKLHELMERQSENRAKLMPLRAAMEAGAIGRPTWQIFCAEFGNRFISAKSGLAKYTGDNYQYTGEDFKEMKAIFQGIIA